jgi:hypothetical protein
MDAAIKAVMKEAIENLPNGKMRKLMDYSTAFRLQVHEQCIVFEERVKKNQAAMLLVINREELYSQGIIYILVHKFIPRPTMSWIEEIESVREGREEAKNGKITLHKNAWD